MATTCHIIKFGYQDFAVDSISAATKAIELLSKLVPVEHITEGDSDGWFYIPDPRHNGRVELKCNQPFYKPSKTPRLPRPKRGAKRCLCGHSDVAPGGMCPSCGLSFSAQ